MGLLVDELRGMQGLDADFDCTMILIASNMLVPPSHTVRLFL